MRSVGAFTPYPDNYPPAPFTRLTKEIVELLIEKREFERIEASKFWSSQLDIPGYIEACSQMNLSIVDWIGLRDDPFVRSYGLPDVIKDALKYEARKVNESIRRKREEEISELKFKSQEPNKSTLSPDSTGSYMNKVFR